jgi:SAM-dependent methyltransferase
MAPLTDDRSKKGLFTKTKGIIQHPKIVRMRHSPQIYDWSYLCLRDLRQAVKSFADTHASPRHKLTIADLGCGNAPYKPFFEGAKQYIGVDAYPGSAVDVVAPIWETGLNDKSIDIAISTEVLEHTRYTQATIKEIHRFMKPGGYVFMTIPFLYPVHSDDDQWRFTVNGLKDLFGEGFDVEVTPLGGPWTTLLLLPLVFLQSYPLGRYIFIPIYILFNILAPILNALTRASLVIFKSMPPTAYKQVRFSVLEAFTHHYAITAKRR